VNGHRVPLGGMTFPELAEEIGPARCRVRRMAAKGLGLDPGAAHETVDDVELLTSEVVTNAIKHTASGKGGRVRLSVFRTDRTIRVEVADEGGAETTPRAVDDLYAESGRGLSLVKALAKEWGMERDDEGGTLTWFEVEL
jgi:anti-sigma regulatory factor (Ser/Thr protein kinase)